MNISSLVCSVVLNFTNGQIIMLSDHTCKVWQNFKGLTAQICQGREDGLAGFAYSFNEIHHKIMKFDDDITNNDKIIG